MGEIGSIEQALNEYEIIRPRYEIFTRKLDVLARELLDVRQLNVHMVEARTKSIASYREKIVRPGKNYITPWKSMPDLAGVRIIVYYSDDVAKVSDILERHFQVLERPNDHSPEKLGADRFGYLSSHYVVKLNKHRAKLAEWQPYGSLHAEFQVRTVLQHSWAAISHALQYKHEADVPSKLQRKLFRLAGLFELADEEFLGIRDARIAVQKEARQLVKEGDKNLEIDAATLSEFIAQWKRAPEILRIADDCKFSLEREKSNRRIKDVGRIIFHATRLGIRTIDQLGKSLAFDPTQYFSALKAKSKSDWIVSLPFLISLMLIKAYVSHFTVELLVADGWDKDIAQRVIETARTLE